MNILAIIPARGGSTRIPGKNLKLLGGKPLIDWTIGAVIDSHVNAAVVSTDSDAVSTHVGIHGRVWPLERGPATRGDGQLEPVLAEVIEAEIAHGGRADAYLLLQPTSPLRTAEDIDAVIALLEGGAQSVVSLVRDPGAHFSGNISGGMWWPRHTTRPRTQDINLYRENGAIWAFTHAEWERTGDRRGSHPVPYVMPAERSLDIDTMEDWAEAERRVAGGTEQDPEAVRRDEALASIDLLVLDCDGVLTDNTVTVSPKGNSLTFHRGDGMGIRLLREAGVPSVVVSGSSDPAIEHRCEAIVVLCMLGCHDKPDAIATSLRAMFYQRQRTGYGEPTYAYVGNDLNDIPMMKEAAVSIAVADAHPDVLAIADLVTTKPGGHGAVREVCDWILKAKGA